MRKKYLNLLLLLVPSLLFGQEKVVPEWFRNDMEYRVGTWIADNSAYHSENEPFEAYVMHWEWGPGKHSIKGKLFALRDMNETPAFWELVQYWDANEQKAKVIQFGIGGAIGSGELTSPVANQIKLLQRYFNQDGSTFESGHSEENFEDYYVSTSYNIHENGEWIENRKYTWIRKK